LDIEAIIKRNGEKERKNFLHIFVKRSGRERDKRMEIGRGMGMEMRMVMGWGWG
jgi:hypothetical protein